MKKSLITFGILLVGFLSLFVGVYKGTTAQEDCNLSTFDVALEKLIDNAEDDYSLSDESQQISLDEDFFAEGTVNYEKLESASYNILKFNNIFDAEIYFEYWEERNDNDNPNFNGEITYYVYYGDDSLGFYTNKDEKSEWNLWMRTGKYIYIITAESENAGKTLANDLEVNACKISQKLN